jgi:hypothetical protein
MVVGESSSRLLMTMNGQRRSPSQAGSLTLARV